MLDPTERARIRAAMLTLQGLQLQAIQLMNELDHLLGCPEVPKEDGPEIEDLQTKEGRDKWLYMNPRPAIMHYGLETMDAVHAAIAADEEEQEATHRDWSAGGGSSEFAVALLDCYSDWYTEDDDGE